MVLPIRLSGYLYSLTGNTTYFDSLASMTNYIHEVWGDMLPDYTFISRCASWNSSVLADVGLLIEALSVIEIPQNSGP